MGLMTTTKRVCCQSNEKKVCVTEKIVLSS